MASRPKVAVAIVFWRNGTILMVRKKEETQWRFPVGLVGLKDGDLEWAAHRELQTQTGMIAGPMGYLGSWRVATRTEKRRPSIMMVAAFTCTDVGEWTKPCAGDGLEEIAFALPSPVINVAHEHIPILRRSLRGRGVDLEYPRV